MQIIITDLWPARSRIIHLTGPSVYLGMMLAVVALMLTSALLYHGVVLHGARAGWPVVGHMLRWVAQDEMETQDRFMRQNLDMLARRVGEMQAQLVQLVSQGERVAALAGVTQVAVSPKSGASGAGGAGGPLVPVGMTDLPDLRELIDRLQSVEQSQAAHWAELESRLFERKLQTLRLPTQVPVETLEVGSAFGWRTDPMTGVQALHTGMDFPAPVGTPIHAAAGGVVVEQTWHPEYGHMLEIDHGQGLVTRYAHASRVLVGKGALVRKGQTVALVGTSGRSTGPHLHFELLVGGVFQDPARLLHVPSAAPLIARGGG